MRQIWNREGHPWLLGHVTVLSVDLYFFRFHSSGTAEHLTVISKLPVPAGAPRQAGGRAGGSQEGSTKVGSNAGKTCRLVSAETREHGLGVGERHFPAEGQCAQEMV